MSFWRKLADRLTSQGNEIAAEDRPTILIYVMLPESIEPLDRGAQFEDPLEAELGLQDAGYISGGGSSLGDEREDGSRLIEFCGIDVDVYELRKGLEVLRMHLPELGCPPGTQLHYRDDDLPLQDEYTGTEWKLAQPRSMMHPGFGV